MAYEQLGDVTTVQLGGVNKESGKPNPTEVEGYLLRVEEKAGKFKPVQFFYVLRTLTGDVGVYGRTNMDRKLKDATMGAMTRIRSTNESIDTGKGNPMKIWDVVQDRSNMLGSTLETSHQNAAVEDQYDYDGDETPAYVSPTKGHTPTPNEARAEQVKNLVRNSARKSI